MGVLFISLALSALVLASSARSLATEQTLARMFGVIVAGVWLYITLMLIAFSVTTQLEVLLCGGLLPVIVVAYGFRYYEQKQKLELEKEKHKHDEESE